MQKDHRSIFFKILNGHENIDPNIFVKIKTGKITRGHDFKLVKGQRKLDECILFLRGPSMSEINCQLILCILGVLICLRLE